MLRHHTRLFSVFNPGFEVGNHSLWGSAGVFGIKSALLACRITALATYFSSPKNN